MSNALLDFSDLPHFDRITPQDVAPAVDVLLERANAALETVTAPDFPARWDAIAKVLDVATERLGTAWGSISHLNSVADTPELRAAYNAALPKVSEFWTRLGAIETPLIAAVSGYALGGGCELALACDMIVADKDARFGLPEVTLGIIPGGGGTQRLTRAIGKHRAMEYVLTGRRFDAEMALAWGLVNHASRRNRWREDAIELADSDAIEVGDLVLAVGNPFGLGQTVTSGIVSATARTAPQLDNEVSFLQTDAAVNPGNSGGALVDVDGRLIGINTAIFSQSGGYQGIGFAVPSNLARRVVTELQQFGEVRRGSIGYVEIAPLTSPAGAADSGGVLVQRMRRDSAAYDGGIRPGDIIVSFNGTPITDGSQLSRLVQDARIGSTAKIGVVRDSRRIELDVPIVSASAQ